MTTLILCDLTPDELFLAIQPDEASREQARQWIKDNPPIIMRTVLHQCPQCKNQHALCWLQRVHGKRELGVICDVSTTRIHKSGVVMVNQHPFVPVKLDPEHPVDTSDLMTFYTAPAKKEAELIGQAQLVIMNTTPGQTVERTIDTKPTDAQRIADLKSCIDTKLLAIATLEDDQREREKVIRRIKGEAQALGAELSVLQTNSLKLDLKP